MKKSIRYILIIVATLGIGFYTLTTGILGLGVIMGSQSNWKNVSILCDNPDNKYDSYSGDLSWSAWPPGWHCNWNQTNQYQFNNLAETYAPLLPIAGIAIYLYTTRSKK